MILAAGWKLELAVCGHDGGPSKRTNVFLIPTRACLGPWICSLGCARYANLCLAGHSSARAIGFGVRKHSHSVKRLSAMRNRLLWMLQAVLAALFLFAGGAKLVMPIAAITKQIPVPGLLLRFVAVAEIAGALGLVLPGLTGIRPYLTPLAALGLMMIMSGAIGATLATGATTRRVASSSSRSAAGVRRVRAASWGRQRVTGERDMGHGKRDTRNSQLTTHNWTPEPRRPAAVACEPGALVRIRVHSQLTTDNSPLITVPATACPPERRTWEIGLASGC